jgi:quercetin dioxygenase-like cupin family protein
MSASPVVRRSDAATFTTTPTDVLRFLVAGDEHLPDITDETLDPGDGPPLHRHPWVTWEVVVEGRIRARVGETTHELEPGDLLFTPADVPHTFMAIGDRPARLIGVNWPGGFHRLYAEIAANVTDGAPDPQAMATAAARHGAEILGPPLAVLESARP